MRWALDLVFAITLGSAAQPRLVRVRGALVHQSQRIDEPLDLVVHPLR